MAAARAAGIIALEGREITRRAALRAWAAIGAVARFTLLRAGIDPNSALALRHAEAAAAELAAIPDSPELRLADADFCARRRDADTDRQAAEAFDAKICDLAGRYRDSAAPDPANASLAMLFAWSLARSTGLPRHASCAMPPYNSRKRARWR